MTISIIANIINIALCVHIILRLKKIESMLEKSEKEVVSVQKKQRKPKIIAHTDEKLYQREKDENY